MVLWLRRSVLSFSGGLRKECNGKFELFVNLSSFASPFIIMLSKVLTTSESWLLTLQLCCY